MKIRLNTNLARFAVVQFVIIAALCILSASSHVFVEITGHGRLWGFRRLLDLGAEQSIPTYFSVLNLLLSSLMLFVLYRDERANCRKGPGYWRFLSILFLFLSLDESVSIHENFDYVRDYLVHRDLMPPLVETHRWLPFGVLFVVIVGLGLIPFLRLLPGRLLRWFLISAGIFVTGALGFELAGALVLKMGYAHGSEDVVYWITQTVEEGLEMAGIAIFNICLYREIQDRELSVVINGS